MVRTADVTRGALLGLVGGLLAAGAMSLAHLLVSNVSPKAEPPAAPKEEDATVKLASAAMGLVGATMGEEQKPLASSIVHYGFGACVGAVYGAVAEIVPRVAVGAGLPFGVVVWFGAHVVVVPALGLAEAPTRRPVRNEAEEFGLHLLYGLTTKLVRRLLRGRRRTTA